MKGILDKKYTVSGKDRLISACVSSVCLTVLLYLALGPYSKDIIKFMQDTANSGTALTVSLIALPVILIFMIIVTLSDVLWRGK